MPPSQRILRDHAKVIFQKYSDIRDKHDPVDEIIVRDKNEIQDYGYIQNTLLSSNKISHLALYNCLDLFRESSSFCFSNITRNPLNFVLNYQNILSFEKALEIIDSYELDALEYDHQKMKLVFDAWIYDFLVHKNNIMFQSKFLVLKAFKTRMNMLYENIGKEDTDVFLNGCHTYNHNKIEYITSKYIFEIESEMTEMVSKLLSINPKSVNSKEFINNYENTNEIKMTNQQKNAIKMVLKNNFSIVCGFPGTGKTTISKCICEYFKDECTFLLAPTGMAVNNLYTKCINDNNNNIVVATIHKMLFDIVYKVKQKPKLIIIDEFSMVDTLMFYKILKWCKYYNCKLVCIADAEQLPPIAAGFPLYNLMQSTRIPIKHLTIIKRQESEVLKNIILSFHQKNEVSLKHFDNKSMIFSNFSEKNIKNIVSNMKCDILNTKFITPQHKSEEGTISLNNVLQNIYNPKSQRIPSLFKINYVFRINDLIIRNVNDYSNDSLYANGDLAYVRKYNNELIISYLSDHLKDQIVTPDKLYEEFSLGYALTIHRVQGSQYDNIVLCIADNHQYSWTSSESKKLLYTAISRSVKRCICLGNPNLFLRAQNPQPSLYLSNLS